MVIDTHVLIWLSAAPERIGRLARAALADALAAGEVLVAAITPWEIATKASRGKLSLSAPPLDWFTGVLARTGIDVADLTPATAVDAGSLPGEIHGDPADRLIIATARALACPVLTADRQILAYAAAGHVQAIDARR